MKISVYSVIQKVMNKVFQFQNVDRYLLISDVCYQSLWSNIWTLSFVISILNRLICENYFRMKTIRHGQNEAKSANLSLMLTKKLSKNYRHRLTRAENISAVCVIECDHTFVCISVSFVKPSSKYFLNDFFFNFLFTP